MYPVHIFIYFFICTIFIVIVYKSVGGHAVDVIGFGVVITGQVIVGHVVGFGHVLFGQLHGSEINIKLT